MPPERSDLQTAAPADQGDDRDGLEQLTAILDRAVEVGPSSAHGPGRAQRSALRELGRHGFLGPCDAGDQPEPESTDTPDPRLALLEELGRQASIGLGLTVASQLCAIEAVTAATEQSLGHALREALCQGRTLAAVCLEPSRQKKSSSMLLGEAATGWVLSGRTSAAPSLIGGDLLIVAAHTGSGLPALALVELEARGVMIEAQGADRELQPDGRATARLDRVEVPPSHLLAGHDEAEPFVARLRQLEQAFQAALLVGAACRCTELALADASSAASYQTRPLASLLSRVGAARQLITTSCLRHPAARPRSPGLSEMALLQADELATASARLCLELGSDAIACFDAQSLHLVKALVTRAYAFHDTGALVQRIVETGAAAARETRPLRLGATSGTRSFEPEPEVSATGAPRRTTGSSTTGLPVAGAEALPAAIRPATVPELFQTLPARARPSRAQGWTARFHFKLRRSDHPEWTVDIKDGSCTVSEGLVGQADCVVRMSEATFIGIEQGTINPQVAFMTRRIKVSDLGQMMRFIKVFGQGSGGRS